MRPHWKQVRSGVWQIGAAGSLVEVKKDWLQLHPSWAAYLWDEKEGKWGVIGRKSTASQAMALAEESLPDLARLGLLAPEEEAEEEVRDRWG